jgi:hypothetical protein
MMLQRTQYHSPANRPEIRQGGRPSEWVKNPNKTLAKSAPPRWRCALIGMPETRRNPVVCVLETPIPDSLFRGMVELAMVPGAKSMTRRSA